MTIKHYNSTSVQSEPIFSIKPLKKSNLYILNNENHEQIDIDAIR